MARRNDVDLARVLLSKAAGDETAVRALMDSREIPDEIVGFHAQQAIEKALKAVLAARAIHYPKTHDLERLIELVEEAGFEVPEEVATAQSLTAWASEFRYEDPLRVKPLDRADALDRVEAAAQWAADLIESQAT